MQQPLRFAAVDIGTVTCRLLLADYCDGRLEILRKGYAITNLGEGVDANGYLLPAAMDRVDAQIAQYRQIIDEASTPEDPVHVIAMATSASRDASNADEFAARLAKYGVELRVIPGEREAALTFLGASQDYPGEELLVVDIGGGSTELIVGVGGQDPVLKHSFNIGCRRVTEKFLHADPPTAAELAEACAWMRPQFDEFFQRVEREGLHVTRMVAVAGTATTVVSVDKEMAVYDSARVHGTVVDTPTLNAVTDRFMAVPTAERRTIVGLDPDRAPVIVAGMLILQQVLDCAGCDVFTVSESDILQGIILDAARSISGLV